MLEINITKSIITLITYIIILIICNDKYCNINDIRY